MIERLWWSNPNSPPKGERPRGPDRALCIAKNGASQLWGTTYPSLALKDSTWSSKILAAMVGSQGKDHSETTFTIRHQTYARSASRFFTFRQWNTYCHVTVSQEQANLAKLINPCMSLGGLLVLNHEDYACLPQWRYLLSQYVYYNCCCCCISACQ